MINPKTVADNISEEKQEQARYTALAKAIDYSKLNIMAGADSILEDARKFEAYLLGKFINKLNSDANVQGSDTTEAK
jgi:hypothetical protein